MIDNKTGQRYFSPLRINSSPKNLNTTSMNPDTQGDYMYSYAKKFDLKKELLGKNYSETLNQSSKVIHTNNTTQVLFNKLKTDAFKKIFHILDKDEDQAISVFNIDLKNIPPTISAIIEPIISKIKIENCSLDVNQFIDYCDQLFEVLSYDKKNVILNFGKPIFKRNKSAEIKFSFKPKINKYSRSSVTNYGDMQSINNSTSSSINPRKSKTNLSTNNIVTTFK